MTGVGTIIDGLGRVLGSDVILDLACGGAAFVCRSNAQHRFVRTCVVRKGRAPLMPNIWSLNLNVELQKTIKQRRFPVQAASDEFGWGLLLTSGFQKAEPP